MDLIHELRSTNNLAIGFNDRWLIPDMKRQIQ
jgi:hypothetical protein